MAEFMDDVDMNLYIPIKSIYEEFVCPICFETIKDCRMTPCGHNYCAACLDECLNLRHVCPVCSQECTVESVVKNKHFDRLMLMIEKEKDQASKSYFDKLIANGGNIETPGDETGIRVVRELSPIEALFQKHMRKSLSNYQSYFDSLQSRLEKRKARLSEQFSEKLKEGGDRDILTRDFEFQLFQLDLNFKKSTDLLLDSYDQYMENISPSPEFLPVTATISLREKGIDLHGVSIDRTWTIVDLREKIMERMSMQGNPIVQFTESNVFVLYQAGDSERNIMHDGIIITDEHLPILQYNPEPGCVIELRGNVVCKSDAPKECFKTCFVEGEPNTMDYYQCMDCKNGIKWICKNCADICHEGHNLKEFLIGHVPEWACCYCERTRNCQLYKR